MPSQQSSSRVVLTQGSPRSSTGSFSSSNSSKSSASSNYRYTSYETSATSNMGRSGYADDRVREKVHRVPDAHPRRETVTTISRGKVDVTNQDSRHVEKWEPRASDARSSDYYKSSSSRRNKK